MILAGLGLCLGLVFFGVSVSLMHFNRLVDPERPLQLLEWQYGEDRLGIKLLGEDLAIRVDRELPGKMLERAGDKAAPVLERASGWLAAARRTWLESGWPEEIHGAAREAGRYFTVTVEQLKE